MDLLAYLMDNFWYFVIVCVTLFFWDLVDLYVDLRNFGFVASRTFGMYYGVRAFFCIALMEAGMSIGLFATEIKYVIAFVIPLGFSAILQNLVVKVGGVDKTIDLSEVFDKFKFRIRDSLYHEDEAEKVETQMELMNSEKVTTAAIARACRFYAKQKEYEGLMNRIKKYATDEERRIELIVWLVERAKTVDIVRELMEGAKGPEAPSS